MKLSLPAIFLGVVIAGCATQPVLKAVDFRYGIYMAGLEIHTTITPDGLLRSVRTSGKGYGANDKAHETYEIRQGHLTPEQITKMAQKFAGWDVYFMINDLERSMPHGDMNGGT